MPAAVAGVCGAYQLALGKIFQATYASCHLNSQLSSRVITWQSQISSAQALPRSIAQRGEAVGKTTWELVPQQIAAARALKIGQCLRPVRSAGQSAGWKPQRATARVTSGQRGRKSSYDSAIFVCGNSAKAHRVRRDDTRRHAVRLDEET